MIIPYRWVDRRPLPNNVCIKVMDLLLKYVYHVRVDVPVEYFTDGPLKVHTGRICKCHGAIMAGRLKER